MNKTSSFNEPTSAEPSTSPSLLDGLREETSEAWERFSAIWIPLIYSRCRRLGCCEEAAKDISQNALLSVFQGFPRFRRDGQSLRLRYWVQGIVRREIANFYRQQGAQAVGGSEIQNVMAMLPSAEEESTVDWFAPAQILARAIDVVQQDVETHNWQAFQLIYFQQHTPQEAAEKLGRQAGAVRQATRRIRQKLQAEVEAMLT